MIRQPITRDERTTVVENAGYRIAYTIMSFGLLIIVAYRGFALQQSSWDLLGLVVLGGIVATAYQVTGRVLSRRWVVATAATLVIAAVLAIALVTALR